MRRGEHKKQLPEIVPVKKQEAPSTTDDLSHIVEEFNIFKLEGLIFDLTRKHDRYRSAARGEGLELDETAEPITIEPHPNYGRPGVGAFKALQVIFYKLTEEGFPYPESVSFTRREFERLRGSIGQGGYQMLRTYHDLRQLETCMIHCSRKDKASGDWQWGSFRIVNKSLWSSPSGSKRDISRFTLKIDDDLIRSLNNHHFAKFNWYRLRELMDAPIAMILYKRFFQNFAGLMDKNGNPTSRTFEKDYQDICSQWLGGLKPLKYKAQIIRDQLGRHIEAIQKTRLGKITVEKRKKGEGFKLVFTPRKGFFEDFERLYRDPIYRPRIPFNRAADAKTIEEPHFLIEYFYRQLGKKKTHFMDSEVTYARELLEAFSYSEIEGLIDVATRHAQSRNFDPYSFMLLRKYVENWKKKLSARKARALAKDRVGSCSLCDSSGYLTLMDPQNPVRSVAYECPHDAKEVDKIEMEKGLKHL